MFPSSGEGGKTPMQLGPLERANFSHWSRCLPLSLEDGNRSTFQNVVFSSFQNTRRWKKSKNPVILSVIHHRQNPLESTLNVFGVLHLVEFEVLTEVIMKNFVFWDVKPCILVKVSLRLGGYGRLRYRVEKFATHESSMKQAVYSSEMLEDFHSTTRPYIPEDRNLT
jgi:hypothetical protein